MGIYNYASSCSEHMPQDRSTINTSCMAQGARGIIMLHILQSNPKLMKRAFMRCKYLRFYFVSQIYIYKDTGSDLDILDVFSSGLQKISSRLTSPKCSHVPIFCLCLSVGPSLFHIYVCVYMYVNMYIVYMCVYLCVYMYE